MKDIVMEAKDLTKKYKEAVVLDHINLQLEKGENIWLHRPERRGQNYFPPAHNRFGLSNLRNSGSVGGNLKYRNCRHRGNGSAV